MVTTTVSCGDKVVTHSALCCCAGWAGLARCVQRAWGWGWTQVQAQGEEHGWVWERGGAVGGCAMAQKVDLLQIETL